jgi:hypothetical protein
MMGKQCIAAPILIVLLCSLAIAGQGTNRYSLKTGATAVLPMPLSMDLEGVKLPDPCVPVLYRIDGSAKIALPCQVEDARPARLWFIPDKTWEPNTVVNLELAFEPRGKRPEEVTWSNSGEDYTFQYRGKNILNYRRTPYPVPAGVDPVYSRGAFIHPLWSPSGKVLTRIQPPDHYHHYGIWTAWTVARYEGKEVDFWNLAKRQGTVRSPLLSTMIVPETGPVYAHYWIGHRYVDLNSPPEKQYPASLSDHLYGRRFQEASSMDGWGEKTVIVENWDIKAFPAQIDGRLVWIIDLEMSFSNVLNSIIELPAYRYGGGIGFRATDDWTRENCSVLTSEGKTREQADGTRARWCDVHGTVDGQTSGIIFMDHPANREHPEPMRVWPSDIDKEKGRFFFEFCPIRLNGWSLQPGKENVLRYRMVVYDGTLDPKTMETLWKNFAYPPVVTVKQ